VGRAEEGAANPQLHCNPSRFTTCHCHIFTGKQGICSALCSNGKVRSSFLLVVLTEAVVVLAQQGTSTSSAAIIAATIINLHLHPPR
jgi:hypothetical protein